MATAHPTSIIEERQAHMIGVARLAITGAVTAAVVFVLCWLGTLLPFSSPTHAYITLFTNAEISSGLALAGGTCWSFLFGLIVGAVFAVIYNATASVAGK